MPSFNFIMQRRNTVLAILAAWTCLALLFVPQTYLANQASPTPLDWWKVLSANFIHFEMWAVLTPLILFCGRKFPLEKPHIIRHGLLQLGSSLIFSLLHIVLVIVANNLFLSWAETYQVPVPFWVLMASYGATNIMIYWGIIAASQAINFFRKYQERDLQLAQAELQVLKMQIHPHFLFNTLNAISELVYEQPEIADQTLGQLSDLLRFSLKEDKAQEISLREEMEFLGKYVEVHQTLLQHRLKVEFEISQMVLNAKVPNMILQPLVENAIRHGIAPAKAGGLLRVGARKINDSLQLTVADNGVGLGIHKEIVKTEGIGLANTRARLAQLYGQAASFEIKNQETGGVRVGISIPFELVKITNDY